MKPVQLFLGSTIVGRCPFRFTADRKWQLTHDDDVPKENSGIEFPRRVGLPDLSTKNVCTPVSLKYCQNFSRCEAIPARRKSWISWSVCSPVWGVAPKESEQGIPRRQRHLLSTCSNVIQIQSLVCCFAMMCRPANPSNCPPAAVRV